MRKVVKFGGSSLASAQQFKKVAEIVHAEASRRYVVPSAPGKRFRKDTKVTDMLYGCYALAEQDEDFSENLHQIEERYQEIIDGLSLTLSLADEFAVIEKNFRAHAGKDYAGSRGEYLNGIVMAAYLGYELSLALGRIFKENGEFDAVRQRELLGRTPSEHGKRGCTRAFMAQIRTEAFARSPEAAPISPVRSLQRRFMRMFTKTGRTYPAF